MAFIFFNSLFINDSCIAPNFLDTPCFELGNLSVEMGYNENQINQLVKSYYGEVNEKFFSRVNLQGIVSDIGWSLWSYIQAENSSLDFDYNTHGTYRLERAINKKCNSTKR